MRGLSSCSGAGTLRSGTGVGMGICFDEREVFDDGLPGLASSGTGSRVGFSSTGEAERAWEGGTGELAGSSLSGLDDFALPWRADWRRDWRRSSGATSTVTFCFPFPLRAGERELALVVGGEARVGVRVARGIPRVSLPLRSEYVQVEAASCKLASFAFSSFSLKLLCTRLYFRPTRCCSLCDCLRCSVACSGQRGVVSPLPLPLFATDKLRSVLASTPTSPSSARTTPTRSAPATVSPTPSLSTATPCSFRVFSRSRRESKLHRQDSARQRYPTPPGAGTHEQRLDPPLSHFVNSISTPLIISSLNLPRRSCLLLDYGTFTSYLTVVKSWLDANPNEVLSIIISNPNGIAPTVFSANYVAAGMMANAYVPPSVPVALNAWPTLSSMIINEKRVVNFLAQNADRQAVPFLIDQFSNVWETPFGVSSALPVVLIVELMILRLAGNESRIPLYRRSSNWISRRQDGQSLPRQQYAR